MGNSNVKFIDSNHCHCWMKKPNVYKFPYHIIRHPVYCAVLDVITFWFVFRIAGLFFVFYRKIFTCWPNLYESTKHFHLPTNIGRQFPIHQWHLQQWKTMHQTTVRIRKMKQIEIEWIGFTHKMYPWRNRVVELFIDKHYMDDEIPFRHGTISTHLVSSQ